MLFQLAYRNIWRNKRRTLITAASVLFAVFFAVVMKSIQVGAWDHMVNNVVSFYFGYAQIHQDGYWDEQTIDKAFPIEERLTDLENEDNIESLVPRLESFALASCRDKSKGVLLIGVDPEKENQLSNLENRVIAGNYFGDGKGVLIAEGLSEYLRLGLGDTIIFISQGYHGANAAGKYSVSGIVSFGSPELNDQLAFMPLKEAQWFYAAEGLITSLVVNPVDPDIIKKTVAGISAKLPGDTYEVMDYEELIPDLIQAKELDIAGGLVIIIILYAIIAFGIFGTMLMMVKEREFEFGILKAIGMHARQINWMLWMETAFLGILGCLGGALLALPLVYYLTVNPITFSGEMAEAYEKFGVAAELPATVDPMIFLNQAIVVILMVTIMALYPMFKIRKLKSVEAMRA
jgi:ABC-type lipoprotein release transport system permease subunit